MSNRREREVPARLEGLRRRFEDWRRTRKGRSRIPETLWTAAVKAAGKYGLNPTARVLRLDYYALKKRLEATGHLSDGGAVATFVELAPSMSSGSRECILELEDPGGSKMRVHLKGIEAPDLAALSRSFWGNDSDHINEGHGQPLAKRTARRRA